MTKVEGAAAPTVSVVIPAYNEEGAIDACLDSIAAQTYPKIVEVLVVDGRSTDATRARVEARGDAKVLDNPRKMQAAALNIGIAAAEGDLVCRVDAHCTLEPDYVERCVAVLEETGAAMVGGPMRAVGSDTVSKGIARAMTFPLGAGPASFRAGTVRGWTDITYLGTFHRHLADQVGGFEENVGVNEDGEFAHKMSGVGGVFLDPAITAWYTPRASVPKVAKQYFRYGLSRSATVRRHPRSWKPRQMVAPALVLGLLSPWRRKVAAAYLLLLGGVGASQVSDGAPPAEAASMVGAVAAMHVPWGLGFLVGMLTGRKPMPQVETEPEATA
jgi:glycosyltransferase involved in cell wall biosynthesis